MKVKEIEELLEFIAKSALEEVNIETEYIKLSVKKNGSVIRQRVKMPDALTSSETNHTTHRPLEEVSNVSTHGSYVEFKAPMIGTFYQSPNPDTPPFVQAGDRIQKGQKLCIIEAMKLFNEIEADIAGTIIEVLVDDASPVEYDQPLFLIDPQ